jgi:hypothetical protein
MKAKPVAQVPPILGNFSDEELIRHVEHYYPNLNGPLRTLLNRFESRVYCTPEMPEGDNEVSCPHCGGTLRIDLEIES